jgi:radical SAM superfamily enzyme YgiQ (UPF0313 family)
VRIVDANTEVQFLEIFDQYLAALRDAVPATKQGNFVNTAHRVLQDHSLGYMKKKEVSRYRELVRLIVEAYFFSEVPIGAIDALDKVLHAYFETLSEYVADLLRSDRYRFVGTSVLGGTLPASMWALRMCKELLPDTTTIMGGGIFCDQLAVGSGNFRSLLREAPYVDHIIAGEGEQLLLDLLEGQIEQGKRVITADDRGGRFLDLADTTVPDYGDLNIEAYPLVAQHASRSCPFQCRFCSETLQWGLYRKKSMNQVVDECENMMEQYATRVFLFCDSLMNPFINALSDEVCRRGQRVYWDGYLRADRYLCTKQNVTRWRQGGLYRARVGVESGSDRVLEAMGKRITVDDIETTLRRLAEAGVKTTTYWVVGYPGESEEDFGKTLELLVKLRDWIYEAECNVFWYYEKGQTKSAEWASKNGIRPVYPAEMEDMLVIQSYCVDTNPTREEAYGRMQRFVDHCRELGIPNPYSLGEIYFADKRWQKIHETSVPSLCDFLGGKMPTDSFVEGNKEQQC